MRADLLLGFDQAERVGVTGANLAQRAQAIAEGVLQFAQELRIGQLAQAFGILRGAGPDQRAAVFRQRQQGHRPVVGEALESLPAMIFGRTDVGDQRGLSIGCSVHANAQLLAQAGTATVGEHGEVAVDLAVVVQGQPVAIAERFHPPHLGRAAPTDQLRVQRMPQTLAEPGVLHHVAEGRHALLHRGKARGAKAAAVGYVDLRDRFGTLGDLLPDAQALVDLPAAEGQRGGTRVIAGLVAVAGGERLDQQDLPATLACAGLQEQRQAGTNQAATDDGDLRTLHLRRPAPGLRPSAPRSRRRSSARRW
ncbi:hypothetical protein D3C78_500380 [compost metagenome]